MSFRGWTTAHDALLRELVHHTQPGGLNRTDPAMGWRELAVKFSQLSLLRGLSGPAFHWNKIAARYYDFIKPLYVEGGVCYKKGEGKGDGEGEEEWEGIEVEEGEEGEEWTVVEK
jgi:hypothetical protein